MNILQNFDEKAEYSTPSIEKTQLLTLFIVKLAFSESVISKLYAMMIIVAKHSPESTILHYIEKNSLESMDLTT